MDPVTLGIAMAALGGVKHFAVDKPAADRQRTLAAATQRYSPWTGLKADAVDDPSLIGNMAQMGGAGVALGSNMQKTDAQNKLVDAQTAWLQNGSSPWSGMRAGGAGPSLGASTDLGDGGYANLLSLIK